MTCDRLPPDYLCTCWGWVVFSRIKSELAVADKKRLVDDLLKKAKDDVQARIGSKDLIC